MTTTPIFDTLWSQMAQIDEPPEPASTRLSVETVWALTLAEQEAVSLGHARLGTEHLLLALVRAGATVGGLLRERGVTLPAARRVVSATTPVRPARPADREGADAGTGWTAAAGTVMDAARIRAGRERRAEVSPVDVVVELLRGRDTVALLAELGVPAGELAAALEQDESRAA